MSAKPTGCDRICQLHRLATDDLEAAVENLDRLPEAERTQLVETLTEEYIFLPRRTYQLDEEKRFSEMLVGFFTNWHLRERVGPESIYRWIERRSDGQMDRLENAAGKTYWLRFMDEAETMGETDEEHYRYFSEPYRLALILRSLVSHRSTFARDDFRYYGPSTDRLTLVAEEAFSYGIVTFYSIDHIVPHDWVVNDVVTALRTMEYEVYHNPLRYVIFTPHIHGWRVSVAEQARTGKPLPYFLDFEGDYIAIGLDPSRIPTCTASHEPGHQLYWQLVEDADQSAGLREIAFKTKIYSLYLAAIQTDGGEMINDSTYTGLLESGHPYIFVEFFPAARHAFVEHGDEFARRVRGTPEGHYSRKLWRFLKEEVYGRDFTTSD